MACISKALRVVFLFQCAATAGWAQTDKPMFSEKGVIFGFGYGVNSQNIPEGKYTPLFFIGHFGIDLAKAKPKLLPQRFSVFFEPQVNAVVLQRPGRNGTTMEAGLNVGLQHMFPVGQNFYIYSLISTGPHFIAVHTERQHRGFIFSDNMGAGTYIFLSPKIALNAGFRIRHMSNANLETPNHGINTINYFLGLSRMIR